MSAEPVLLKSAADLIDRRIDEALVETVGAIEARLDRLMVTQEAIVASLAAMTAAIEAQRLWLTALSDLARVEMDLVMAMTPKREVCDVAHG